MINLFFGKLKFKFWVFQLFEFIVCNKKNDRNIFIKLFYFQKLGKEKAFFRYDKYYCGRKDWIYRIDIFFIKIYHKMISY